MNKALLDLYIKNKDKGSKTLNDSPGLLDEFRKSLSNFYKKIVEFNSFEIASITKTLYKWENTNKKTVSTSYFVRDIVMVDLGLGYGFELSYEHPCIILNISSNGFFLAIPCSTGKYHKNSKYILKGNQADGFQNKTGVLIDSIRAISQTRISHKVGEITPAFLDYINSNIMKIYLPKETMIKRNIDRDLYEAKQEITRLETEINRINGLDNGNEGIELIQ